MTWSEPDLTFLENHLEHSCDCPLHVRMEPLISELNEAQAEVGRLRSEVQTQRTLQLPDGPTTVASSRLGTLGHLRRRLSWAFADSD